VRPSVDGARRERHTRRRGIAACVAAALVGLALVAAAGAPARTAHPTGIGIRASGGGTVTSAPSGISCGSACYAGFEEGTVVTLTAAAAAGETFVGWDGCEPRDHPTCTVTVWDLECVDARFTGSGRSSPPLFCSGAPSSPAMPPPVAPADEHPGAGSACTVSGTPSDDVLRGTAGNDVICGRGGDDRIRGGGGHDRILGERGDDVLDGQAGRDHLVSGPGNDVLTGGDGNDELFGGRGGDLLRARDGLLDEVDGGSGRDRARIDAGDLRRSIEKQL
jgi:hypothetical protein